MKPKLASALVLLVAQLALPGAHAFPDRPIKLVVSSPAGGPPDIMARLLSDRMGALLGQPVVVENRPGGAGGTIGAKSVLSAEPDGHTLMMGSTSSLLIAPLVYKNAGYTTETFLPVAGLSESTEVLAVHPSVKAGSVAELIAVAKQQPGILTYGSAGIGTLPHIEGELLKARALASDDLKQAFAKIGATARPARPDELAVYLQEQQRRWSRIVETTKISLD